MTKPSSETIISVTAALFFLALVIYLFVQDSTAVGPL